MDERQQIEILSDGTITASPDTRDRLAQRRGRYRLAVDTPGFLLFRADEENDARVLMAGEIITRMTVMEVINLVATANWRGQLHILGANEERVLMFDRGALKSVRSNAVDERLGEVLFQQGVLTRAQVDSVAAQVGERRFGEICVGDSLIDSTVLYQNLQQQAESVFFGALLVAEGHYAFVVGENGESSTPVHLTIQGLLMEGVQRIDEMALFRDKIPSSTLCPERLHDCPEPQKLTDTAKEILKACTGRLSIEDIARDTGYGEFQTTKAIYHLLQQKQIALRTTTLLDPTSIRLLVEQFNEVLQDIFVAVATYGGLEQTRETLAAWIVGSGYGPYFGEGVDEFGGISAEHVVNALKGVKMERPLEALHQALHELAAFALFSATTTLPRDQELGLARDVNARLKAIRIS